MPRYASFDDDVEIAATGSTCEVPSVIGLSSEPRDSAIDRNVAISSSPGVLPQTATGQRDIGSWMDRNASKLHRSWRRKQEQPSWESARTAELRDGGHVSEGESARRASGRHGTCPTCARWWWTAQGWLLAVGTGVMCFVSYAFIEVGVKTLSSIRYGYCTTSFFKSEDHCGQAGWHDWGSGVLAFVAYVAVGTGFAAASSFVVTRYAPTASGSGIPEVKTILNGFVLPDVLTFRTLCVKVVCLVLSVSSGMALGHEGPMVHVGVCWAHILCKVFRQFDSEGKKRELMSAGAAAGISSAFGTPIGGVLFSLEEVSSHFPSSALLLAFVASVASTLVLSVANLAGNGKLTLYSVTYTVRCHPSEYVVFALLGVTGGFVGAVFNALNIRWNSFRAKRAYKKKIGPVAEVALVACLTLVSSWPLALTQPLNAEVIHALFDTCSPDRDTKKDILQAQLGLCSPGGEYSQHPELLVKLGAAALIRFTQTVFTIGVACPAGLFVPALFIGACLGRCMGGAVKAMQASDYFFPYDIDPGVYSMVGAAAVLGGVSRMTISLVVIMLELTGGPEYVLPFMLAVLLSKAVGDSLNEGIYDLQIVLKGYPFLHEEVDAQFTECCRDAMETLLVVVDTGRGCLRVEELRREILDATSFRGFPVVDGARFVGYIRRQQLQGLFDRAEESSGPNAVITLEQLLLHTDTTVLRMVPEAPLTQAHQVFKQLGCQHIFIVGPQGPMGPQQDALLGILSKKSFLRFMHDRGNAHHSRRQQSGSGDISLGGYVPRSDGDSAYSNYTGGGTGCEEDGDGRGQIDGGERLMSRSPTGRGTLTVLDIALAASTEQHREAGDGGIDASPVE